MQPDRILHYRIERHVGSGSFGDVYLASDEKLDRLVAIKIAAPKDDEELQKEVVARFELEIGATVRLVHPNIVTVYDAGSTDDFLFYVMAYLPGGDLKKNNNSLSSNTDIAKVIIDVAKALAYAHDMGFVHRDIKPENILFDAHGNAVLADFGIVKAMGQDYTKGRYIVGTPSYSAPEQLTANEEIDGRADLYSLGKVLHFMLTKRRYGVGDTESLPAERAVFQPALNKMLSTDKNDRFQNAQHVIRVFESLLIDFKRSALDDTVINAQGGQLGMRKTTIGMGIAMAVIIGIVGLFLKARGPHDTDQLSLAISEIPPPVEDRHDKTPVAVATDAIVSITTEPEGAEVLLDGVRVGTTPFLSESMPVGEQTLTLQKRFYRSETLTLVLESKKIAKRDIHLSLGSGGLSIITSPVGARVWIDGKPLTGETPLSIDNVTSGPRTIDIRKGDVSQRSEIEVEHDQVTLLRATLIDGADRPEVSTSGSGTFAINSNPPGAEVHIDGKKVGLTPFEAKEIVAGIHHIKLTHKFYADSEFEAEISQQSPVKRFIELEPGSGGLSVITEPEGATVRLDGKQLKGLTPLSLNNITAGRHNIDIRKGDLRLQQDIEVINNSATVVDGKLEAGTLIAFDNHWFSADELLAEADARDEVQDKLKIYQAILVAKPEHETALVGLDNLKSLFLAQLERLKDKSSYQEARELAAFLKENFGNYFELPDLNAEIEQHKQEHELAGLKAAFAKQDKQIRELLQIMHFAEAESLLEKVPDSARSLDAHKALTRHFEQSKLAFQQRVAKVTGALVLVKLEQQKYLRAFAHEVTFSQWDSCVKDAMCSHKPNDYGWGRGTRPVVDVSFEDINREFIPWINQKTGLDFRLPTETEWNTLYGNTTIVGHRQANGPSGFGWGDDAAEFTANVGSYQKNANGLYDLNGNVWEWVDECADSNCARRILKGGSWNTAPKFFSKDEHWPEFPSKRSNDIGFRLVEAYRWRE